MNKMKKVLSVTIFTFMVANTVQAQSSTETPSLEQMWQVIQQQEKQIEQLQNELNIANSGIRETKVITESLADVVEDQQNSSGNSLLSSWTERTRLGGYGEVLYNSGTQTSDSSTSNPSDEIDVQRFVLYFANEFKDNLRFFSELEIEHTNTAAAGEVELEQAYIEWDYAHNHNVLAGLHLVPLGFLNETHEPETFYGVERNRIESRIIPTTYRVNGIKFAGNLAQGLRYDFALHEGLQLADDFSVRSSRQGGSRANFEDVASTLRLKYTAVPGLELGAALHYQSDLLQSGVGNSRLDRPAFALDASVDGLLTEFHAAYQQEVGFGFRALYARWDIDDAIESILNTDGELAGIGRNEQEGWYIEPSWRFNDSLGVFARREFIDETAGDNDNSSEENRTLLGVNYWLYPNVVLKADIQFDDDEDESDDNELDGFNLGVGWSF